MDWATFCHASNHDRIFLFCLFYLAGMIILKLCLTRCLILLPSSLFVLFFFFVHVWLSPDTGGVEADRKQGKGRGFCWVLRCLYLTLTPSFSSTRIPFSWYSSLVIQKLSLSFMMSASTAPPRNTICLRRGGSSIRILNFFHLRWEEGKKQHKQPTVRIRILCSIQRCRERTLALWLVSSN